MKSNILKILYYFIMSYYAKKEEFYIKILEIEINLLINQI